MEQLIKSTTTDANSTKNNEDVIPTKRKRIVREDGPSMDASIPSEEIFHEAMNEHSQQTGWWEDNPGGSKSPNRSQQRSPTPPLISLPKPKEKKPEDIRLVVVSDSDEEDKEEEEEETTNAQQDEDDEDIQIIVIQKLLKPPEESENFDVPSPSASSLHSGSASIEITSMPNQNQTHTKRKTMENGNGRGSELKNKEIPEKMMKIVLTRSKLNKLAKAPSFCRAVTGCFVRVIAPGLSEKHDDLILIDEIMDAIEPYAYQHFWFPLRLRLRNFGDLELTQIHEEALKDVNDLRSWICYKNVKNEPLPTIKFIQNKSEQLLAAENELKASEKPPKLLITREDLAKIVLSPETLRSLSKLEFDRFRSIVTDCFVCMPAIRKDLHDDCQYHIVRVTDCIRGPDEYKVKDLAIVNYQLVFPQYGKYNITWLRESFSAVSDAGFRQWIMDMRTVKESIPTFEQISEKAINLQMALNEAEKIPSYADKKRMESEAEKRAKREHLPIQTCVDMNRCVLRKQQLQKLATLLTDRQNGYELLEKTMSGSFVRIKIAGSVKDIQADQIRYVELIEKKPDLNLERVQEKTISAEHISVLLKFTGSTTLKELINNASAFPVEQGEFENWLRKMHSELDQTIPTYGYVEKKGDEIMNALKEADKWEDKQHKEKQAADAEAVRNERRQTQNTMSITSLPRIPKRPVGVAMPQQPPPLSTLSYQSGINQWRPRKEIRETPGLPPTWGAAPRVDSWHKQSSQDPLHAQQSSSASEYPSNSWIPLKTQSLSKRLLSSDSDPIDFVREREPSWRTQQPEKRQSQYFEPSTTANFSRYDDMPGQSPSTFFNQSKAAAISTATQEIERALGYRHGYDGLLRLDLGLDRTAANDPSRSYTRSADDWASSTSNASISNSIAMDAFRRAMPDDLVSKMFNQRQLSTSSNSHYNTIEPRSVHNYSSSAYSSSSGAGQQQRGLRQQSPQPPPVLRFYN